MQKPGFNLLILYQIILKFDAAKSINMYRKLSIPPLLPEFWILVMYSMNLPYQIRCIKSCIILLRMRLDLLPWVLILWPSMRVDGCFQGSGCCPPWRLPWARSWTCLRLLMITRLSGARRMISSWRSLLILIITGWWKIKKC